MNDRDKSDSGSSSGGSFWSRIVILIGAVGALAVLAAVADSPLKAHLPLSASGAIAAITGGSIAIERSIESIWTWVDLSRYAHWPTGVRFARLEAALKSAKAVFADANALLSSEKLTLDEKIAEAKRRTASIRALLATLKVVTGANFAEVTGAISRADDALATLDKELDPTKLKTTLDGAANEIAMASSLLDVFSSNPPRRLFSILLGVTLGMFGAWMLGLDAYSAVNAGGNEDHAKAWIGLTGFVMGLGSTPTHELISYLQKRKRPVETAA
jgi:hypothetical protein